MYRYLFTLVMMLFLCSKSQAYDIGAQAKIPVDSASYIAVDNRDDLAAVVSKKNQSLTVIDTKSNAIVKTVQLATAPSGVVVGDGKIVVAGAYGQLWLFDRSGEIVAMVNTDLEIISIAAGGPQTVIIATPGAIKSVDMANGQVADLARIMGGKPRLYASQGKLVLTEENNGNTDLTVFDRKTGTVNKAQVAGNITSIGIDGHLGHLVATLSGKTALSLFDIATLNSVGDIETDRLIANVSVNPSTHAAVMTSLADGNMVIVSLEGKLVERTYPFFESATETAIDTSRNIAWVALSQGISLVKLENPVPSLDTLVPDRAVAGSDGFLLSIMGNKFLKGTQTWFNNKPLDVLFDSNQLLKSELIPDDLIYPGNVTVQATNPPPGGGTSNALTFKILTPIPVVTGVSPGLVPVGNPAVVRVEGKNFLPNAKVLLDGREVGTYFVSSIVLQANLGAEWTGAEAVHKVSVVNTGETSAASNQVDLRITSAPDLLADQAATEMTQSLQKGALRGKILNTKKEPLSGVTISYKSQSVKTGSDGTFVLTDIPEGRRTFLVDGSTASDPIGYYPAIPVTADITANVATQLSFTPHLHQQKNRNFTRINPGQETIVTDPEMSGYELRIQKDNRIIGWDGRVNDKVSMRIVPLDRLPIRPVPDNSHVRTVTMFFFDKVGGGRPDQPVPFKSPNILRLKPGEKATLWYYDESTADNEAPNDWAIAGTGTVSSDGRYITTDPGTGIPKFCCGATAWGGLPDGFDIPVPNGRCPTPGGDSGPGPFSPKPGRQCAVDPVDVSTGYFFHNETDMVVPGIIPIKIKRYYVSRLGGSAVSTTGGDGLGEFGKGMSFELDWKVVQYGDMVRLFKPGGSFFDFGGVYPSAGGGFSGSYACPSGGCATTPSGETAPPPPPTHFINSTNPEFIGAYIDVANGKWTLTTRDGWTYFFEQAGGLVRLHDRNFNTVAINRHYNIYDTSGYITSITNAEGKNIVFNQTIDGTYFVRTDSVVGPDGRSVSYIYDTDPHSVYPRLKEVVKPDGSKIQYGYDSQGRMNTAIDGNGVVKFTNVYDANDRVTSQTSADGGVATFNYEVVGGTVTQTNLIEPNGSLFSWGFNPSRYVASYTTPDGTTTYSFDSSTNNILSIYYPGGRGVSYTYNSTADASNLYTGNANSTNGLVKSVTDSLGQVSNFEYESSHGFPTKVTNALGISSFMSYYFNGHALVQAMAIDPLLNVTTIQFNSHGMPVAVTDPNDNTSTLTYDANNPSQLLSDADPLGNTTSYTYDGSGRVATVTDAKGATSSFRYDNADRTISSTDAAGNTTFYTYDGNGNLLTLTDVKGNITSYQYDNMNRLLKRTDRLGKSETYVYYTGSAITPTTGQNLKSYTDKRGQVTTFDSYDAMDRLRYVTFGDGSTIQYTYDAAGRMISIADSISGTISYTHDALDRVTQESTPAGTIDYTYDALGRRETMTIAGEPTVSYGYDDANRLTSVSRIVGGVLRNYTLGYDDAGRRSSLHIPLATTGNSILTSYSFDEADRLEGMVHQSPVEVLDIISYTSDPNGNRTSMGRSVSAPPTTAISGTSYNSEYEMLSYNSNTLAYDENGNLTSKTDADGNITSYTWDARNRLVAIDAPTLANPLHATFQYDALNRRIWKSVNGTNMVYLYDGANIVQDIVDGVKSTYIRTLNVDEPLTKVIGGSGTGETIHHYLQDGLVSIIGIVNDTGNQLSSFVFGPYGFAENNDYFGFTGREIDGTGLMYYRARYYSTEMMRFVSRDPLGFGAEDVSFYGYVRQNPVNRIDSFGLWYIDINVTGGNGKGGTGGIQIGPSGIYAYGGVGYGTGGGASVTFNPGNPSPGLSVTATASGGGPFGLGAAANFGYDASGLSRTGNTVGSLGVGLGVGYGFSVTASKTIAIWQPSCSK